MTEDSKKPPTSDTEPAPPLSESLPIAAGHARETLLAAETRLAAALLQYIATASACARALDATVTP
jgi:hypothetical protein